jgi:hypothetical protein
MEGAIVEIFIEKEKLMKIELSPQADGLDVIACFEALRKSFDASSWGNICAFDSLEAEEPTTGRKFKIVCPAKTSPSGSGSLRA